jgi:hypothetical protein
MCIISDTHQQHRFIGRERLPAPLSSLSNRGSRHPSCISAACEHAPGPSDTRRSPTCASSLDIVSTHSKTPCRCSTPPFRLLRCSNALTMRQSMKSLDSATPSRRTSEDSAESSPSSVYCNPDKEKDTGNEEDAAWPKRRCFPLDE